MARKNTRVQLNREALTELGLGLADGLEEVAKTVLEVADPPDRTPYGVGLAKNGGYLVYVGGKKVAGGGLDGKQPQKPRSYKPSKQAISAIVGFGFPGRFQEMGTVNHGAQPFLTPAVNQVVPQAGDIMRDAVGARLKRVG